MFQARREKEKHWKKKTQERGNSRKHSADLRNNLKLASGGILEVQGRVPVGRAVLLDTAGGAVSRDKVAIGGGGRDACQVSVAMPPRFSFEGLTVGAVNGVDVGSSSARRHHGVDASKADATLALHAEEGIGTDGQVGGDASNGEDVELGELHLCSWDEDVVYENEVKK